jgi:chromate transport protein ChrA
MKLEYYVDFFHINRLAFGGGFVANSLFRKKINNKKQ